MDLVMKAIDGHVKRAIDTDGNEIYYEEIESGEGTECSSS
jgi:hypothetical protein